MNINSCDFLVCHMLIVCEICYFKNAVHILASGVILFLAIIFFSLLYIFLLHCDLVQDMALFKWNGIFKINTNRQLVCSNNSRVRYRL